MWVKKYCWRYFNQLNRTRGRDTYCCGTKNNYSILSLDASLLGSTKSFEYNSLFTLFRCALRCLLRSLPEDWTAKLLLPTSSGHRQLRLQTCSFSSQFQSKSKRRCFRPSCGLMSNKLSKFVTRLVGQGLLVKLLRRIVAWWQTTKI